MDVCGSVGRLLTLQEARAISGLKDAKLRHLLDSGAVTGAWVPGPGGRHRRWSEQSLLSWAARAGYVSPDAAAGGGGPAEMAGELSRLRTENVSLREAALLAGLAAQQVEAAWRASDEADRHRRRAQRLLRTALDLQRQALTQFLVPGDARGAEPR